MSLHPWVAAWGEQIAPSDLQIERAKQFATFLEQRARRLTQNIRAFSNRSAEAVLFDLSVERPQRSPIAIEAIEPLAVIFSDYGPLVLSLRSDFPDTMHQNLVPEGYPSSLCMDNRPWSEAKLTWTPEEMLERIQLWFRRAARDELQDATQPVEPFFGGSSLQIVVSRAVFAMAAENRAELVGKLPSASNPQVMVTTMEPADIRDASTLLSLVAYQVAPDTMRRMRAAPANLASLTDFLAVRDIDLVADLRSRIKAWAGTTQSAARGLAHQFGIILDLPIVNPANELVGGTQTIALLTHATVGEVGEALGVLERNISGTGFAEGYVPLVTPAPSRPETIAFKHLTTVHIEYDRERAVVLSGQTVLDDRAAVLIGAGTIGSHVAEFLYREGRFTWSIIDDDFLLPHNLAKHTLAFADTGKRKAVALLEHLKGIRADPGTGVPIIANILEPDGKQEALDDALSSASIVLDATASVSASRTISDITPTTARAASFFFNPTGTAAVLLLEDAERSITLRDLEAHYYRMVLEAPPLASHLAVTDEAMLHTGACRALTNAIPESRAALLSGLVANALGSRLLSRQGFVGVWTQLPDGGVHFESQVPVEPQRLQRADWTVVLDDSIKTRMHRLRNENLPSETGGVLVGILDNAARKMHVMQALPAPADSHRSEVMFERGIQDLTRQVQQVAKTTMGQVRYLGEWHSHPSNSTTNPSMTDIRQLAWLADLLAPEGIPALMIIVGDDDIEVIMAKRES